jgi:hypothetical protein
MSVTEALIWTGVFICVAVGMRAAIEAGTRYIDASSRSNKTVQSR